jgi:hypothetical protein
MPLALPLAKAMCVLHDLGHRPVILLDNLQGRCTDLFFFGFYSA